MTTPPRTLRLRLALRESQAAFAARLGQSQVTVCRLEAGQAETGPQALLLDHIEAQLAAGLIGPAQKPGEPGEGGPGAGRPDDADRHGRVSGVGLVAGYRASRCLSPDDPDDAAPAAPGQRETAGDFPVDGGAA